MEIRHVTSFTLVWIKIAIDESVEIIAEVTSFTLVWIKIDVLRGYPAALRSRASRSCGLK